MKKSRSGGDCIVDFDEMLRDRSNENPNASGTATLCRGDPGARSRSSPVTVRPNTLQRSFETRSASGVTATPVSSPTRPRKGPREPSAGQATATEVFLTQTEKKGCFRVQQQETLSKMNEYVFEKDLDVWACLVARNTLTSAVKERLTPLQAKHGVHALKGGWRDSGQKFCFLFSPCF